MGLPSPLSWTIINSLQIGPSMKQLSSIIASAHFDQLAAEKPLGQNFISSSLRSLGLLGEERNDSLQLAAN